MRNYLILGAIISAIIALTIIQKNRGTSGIEVETLVIDYSTIETSVIASGSLVFRNEVQLTSEVIAKVTEVTVDEGDYVEQGQILLRLDQEQFQANVEQREASVRIQQIAIERQEQQLQNLKNRWQRQKSLWDAELIQEEEFETIDHRLDIAQLELNTQRETLLQAQAQLNEAQDLLKKTIIRSPISGRVTTLDIKTGETVISGTTNIVGSSMMTIADTSDIITEVYVDESDIATLEVGQRAVVYAVAYPNTPIEGTVESIASTARAYPGRQGLSFKVKLTFNDTKTVNLFSGMSCRAEIFQMAGDPLLTVPVEAVITEIEGNDSQHYVYIVEGDKAVKNNVILGVSSDDSQGILEGLEQGQSVIIGPFRTIQTLSDGNSIKILKDKQNNEA